MTEEIQIVVTNPQMLQEKLAAAERTLQERAMQTRQRGILLRRHGAGVYSAELSDAVPFGTTQEVHD